MDPFKLITDIIWEDYMKLLAMIDAIITDSNVTDERVIFLKQFIEDEAILFDVKNTITSK